MKLRFSGTAAKKGSKAAKKDVKKAKATAAKMRKCSKPVFTWIAHNSENKAVGKAWAVCGTQAKPHLVSYDAAKSQKAALVAAGKREEKAAKELSRKNYEAAVAAEKAERDAAPERAGDYEGYRKRRKGRKSRR